MVVRFGREFGGLMILIRFSMMILFRLCSLRCGFGNVSIGFVG